MEARTLIDALVKKSLLSEELGQKLIVESRETKRSVEAIIYERRLLDEISVAEAKSEILGIPYHKIKSESITDEVINLVPADTAVNYKLIPLSLDNKLLVAGMVNPEDPRAQEALRFIAKSKGVGLGAYIITPGDLEIILRRYSPYQSEIDTAIKSINVKPGRGLAQNQKVVSLEEGIVVSEEAPIIKIVTSTLKAAVADNASDIHIEPQRKRLRIRFRVDGALQEVVSLPLELHQPIISRVKILSDLKIDESRIPQDGRFRTIIFGRDIDFRVSTFPTPVGEKVAIRVLDPSVGLRGIDNLGVDGQNARLVQEAIKKPYGMILVTGPTGSGKTTTLYALLQILNKDEVNILSLEDPVEYLVGGINQSQVHPEIGYDFASGLRQTLRQDPDVIMVGEIRDTETAKLAVHAALTGHIVLSTLHTNNAIGVIPRLIDMGIEPFLLPSSLNLMIGQRLIRQLCDKCRIPVDPSPEVQEIIKQELDQLKPAIKSELKLKPPYKVYKSPGCKDCKNKGVTGRVAVFEIFTMTRELEAIINSGATESKILEETKRQGMITMRQDGIIKALRGLVAIEEVLRETSGV